MDGDGEAGEEGVMILPADYSDDARGLWSAAQALNRAATAVSPRADVLPPLLFFTDPERTPRPWRTAACLPAGAAVVYRAFGAPDARGTGRRLRRVTRAAGVRLLVGLDFDLARAIQADGVHLPEREASMLFVEEPLSEVEFVLFHARNRPYPYERLEDLRAALGSLASLRESEAEARVESDAAQRRYVRSQQALQEARVSTRDAVAALEVAKGKLDQHQYERPVWFAVKRMFGAQSAKRWEIEHRDVAKAHDEAESAHRRVRNDEGNALKASAQAQELASGALRSHAAARAALENAQERCSSIHVGDGACAFDDQFFR